MRRPCQSKKIVILNIAARILKMVGWRVNVTAPDFDKCIICVAPHTSNWDFVLGKLAYWAVCRKAGFLMKSSWFFFPLGMIFKAIGGVPVYRNEKRESLVDQLVERYNSSTHMALAITPEGTRSRTARWHTGFLNIAYRANIPILLGVLDYGNKYIDVSGVFYPTGDNQADMRVIKQFYSGCRGKYPDKFTTADE
ncbi:MAG: 1-acyl-sn-glycerol-3-phosphate acyltransferase [Muribaculaceae bacterium]|nr:1-acyl-sn-glycerol-3-phosphate acyltransferase [Muribaculaceae bacterium]